MRRAVRLRIWLFTWTATVAFAGGTSAETRLRVIVTIPPVFSFAASVGGELAAVEMLATHGDAHDFQLSTRDVRRVTGADLLVKSGLGLDAPFDTAFKGLAGETKLVVIESFSEIPREALIVRPGGRIDAHVWMDPRLARPAVTNILRAFQKLDPRNASRYERNAHAYLDRLEKLDADLEMGLEVIRSTPFVTEHDAFAYFARRYRLNLVGVVETVADVDASPQGLKQLYAKIRETGARAILTEPKSTSRLARQVAADLALKLGELDTMESGRGGKDDYEQRMRANLESLRRTLR